MGGSDRVITNLSLAGCKFGPGKEITVPVTSCSLEVNDCKITAAVTVTAEAGMVLNTLIPIGNGSRALALIFKMYYRG